jgi:hypothetical protein
MSKKWDLSLGEHPEQMLGMNPLNQRQWAYQKETTIPEFVCKLKQDQQWNMKTSGLQCPMMTCLRDEAFIALPMPQIRDTKGQKAD